MHAVKIDINNHQKKRIISGEYYMNRLNRFNDDLKEKRQYLTQKKVLSHQDKTKVHKCGFAIAQLIDLGYTSVIFSAFRRRWLLPVSKLEEMTEVGKRFGNCYCLEKCWTKCKRPIGNFLENSYFVSKSLLINELSDILINTRLSKIVDYITIFSTSYLHRIG